MPARPFIPVPNTASVELIYLWSTVTCENVIHVSKGSPYTLAQLQALRDLVISWWNTNLRTGVTPTCALVRIRTKALDTATSPIEDYTLPTPLGGTNGASSLTTNASFCVKLATGLAGRSQRGRWYYTGMATSALGSPVDVTAGFAAFVVAGLTALKTALTGAGHTWVITSYMTGGAFRSVGQNTPVVTAVAVDNHVDSQRRRLGGRGI